MLPQFIDPSILARLNAESLAMGNPLAGAFQTPLPPLTPPVTPVPNSTPMVPEASGFSGGTGSPGKFLGMSGDQLRMLLGKIGEQFTQRQQAQRDSLRHRLANAPGVQSPAASAPAFHIPHVDFKGLLGGRG